MLSPRKRAFAALVPALLALSLTARAAVAVPTPTERALLRAVNQARLARGLPPVRLDARLERAARAHTRTMLRRDRFAHGAFSSRMVAVHAPGRVRGENLAWGWGRLAAPPAIVRAWLRSAPHRRNLLRPGFVRIGIGAVDGWFRGRRHTLVVTADFAGS